MDVFRRLFHAGESAGDAVGATEAAVGVKADAECAENAAISQEFLDRFPGGMFRYAADDSDEIEYANAGLLHLFGCDDRDQFVALTGGTFAGMVHPADRDRVLGEILSLIHI